MKNDHLSEEEMQQYSLGYIKDPLWPAHVDACSFCRLQVKTYQLLSQMLHENDEPPLLFDAEKFVSSQIQPVRVTETKRAFPYLWLAGPMVFQLAMAIIFRVELAHLFFGINPVALALTVVFFTGVIIMRLNVLYRSYHQKLLDLNYL
jgi:hypothetical protein